MPDPLDGIELITGDCRVVLAGMEVGSVQCVVSSPPYWSLRDYGLEPSVWGGYRHDLSKCSHEWGKDIPGDPRGGSGPGAKECYGGQDGEGNYARKVARGAFCTICGAWRGCLGLEPTPDLYVAHIIEVMRGVRRVLREDGVLWLNLGDSYSAASTHGGHNKTGPMDSQASLKAFKGENRLFSDSLKPKDLCCIPWRVAMALQADGWYLRAALPWVKRSAMPESASDRPNSAVEYVFQLTKQPKYYFDMEAVRVALAPGSLERDAYGWNAAFVGRHTHPKEPRPCSDTHDSFCNPAGRHFRNGDLWFQSISEPHGMVFLDDEPVGLDVTPAGFGEAHFATFPPKLVEPLIKAGTSEKGCCPECGKPWERAVDRSGQLPCDENAGDDLAALRLSNNDADRRRQMSGAKQAAWKAEHPDRFLGWRPGCKCDAGEPIPCTVCDIFSGAGTVALVAARLGRRCIGIEAKADYNEMAEKRIGRALRPATYQDTSEPGPGEAPLFAEATP